MKTLFTLLFGLTFVYSITSSFIPSFSVNDDVQSLTNDSVIDASSTLILQNVTVTLSEPSASVENLTIIEDQLVVPKTAIANVTDILLSEKDNATVSNTSAEATTVIANLSTVPTTTTTEDNDEIKVQENDIVVPKEAIDNLTLELIVTTSSLPPSTASPNTSIENEIVVPKTAIITNDSSTSNNDTEIVSTSVDPTLTSETVEPNQAGLGPISVHKRSLESSEYADTSSVMFEKYDKWTGPGAITSQEILQLKKKGLWVDPQQAGKKETRRRREASYSEEEMELGGPESSEDQIFQDTLKNAITSQESSSRENGTSTRSTDSNATKNASNANAVENLGDANQQHLKDPKDEIDEIDDSICAVNKDDEEATKVVTIFWRSVFCVIFVIIVVYPIYSYTKIYCVKRRKYAESISNERFVGSDSEVSNTTNDCPTPTTTATPTPTTK